MDIFNVSVALSLQVFILEKYYTEFMWFLYLK